jgi:hypothetical protein
MVDKYTTSQGDFMITETAPIFYSVRVNGITLNSNIPSRQLAEMAILNLPVEQRALAEIVQTTTDGKVVLFG